MDTASHYPIAVSQILAALVNIIWMYFFGENADDALQASLAVVVQAGFALASQAFTRSKASLREDNRHNLR